MNREASTRGACGCLVVYSVDHLGKKIQNLSGTLFTFEIFENRGVKYSPGDSIIVQVSQGTIKNAQKSQ